MHPADKLSKQKAEKLRVLFGYKSLPRKAGLAACVTTLLHAATIICLGQRSCLSWRALPELQRKEGGGGEKGRNEKKGKEEERRRE